MSFLSADFTNYRRAENPTVKPALHRLLQNEFPSQWIQAVPQKLLRFNANGSVRKKDTGEPRPFTDMSRPINPLTAEWALRVLNSVNDYIPCGSYPHKTTDDAMAFMRPGCFFAAVGIKSAYRWFPVYRPHRTLEDFRWAFSGSYLFFTDNFLCFGLRNALSCKTLTPMNWLRKVFWLSHTPDHTDHSSDSTWCNGLLFANSSCSLGGLPFVFLLLFVFVFSFSFAVFLDQASSTIRLSHPDFQFTPWGLVLSVEWSKVT